MPNQAPVITIDGPSGSGKGTLAQLIAQRLGWHLLDSGAIYRVLALAAIHHDVDLNVEEALVPLAAYLDVQFVVDGESKRIQTILEGEDVSSAIRTERVGAAASRVAAYPSVREALLRRQRAFRQNPGLVADGRDMGTVVFKEAEVKIFLTASAEVRAERRYLQLQNSVPGVTLAQILADVQARDERDTQRSTAPLRPAEDALLLDSSEMNIEQVTQAAFEYIAEKLKSVSL